MKYSGHVDYTGHPPPPRVFQSVRSRDDYHFTCNIPIHNYLLIIRGCPEFNTLSIIERIKFDKYLYCTIPTGPTVIYYTWNVCSNEIIFCIFLSM